MDKTQLLETIVKAADDKRADDIVALDMQGVSLLADYFVIMNGNTERQVQAIVDGIEDAVLLAGGNQPRIEGKKGSRWMLMDFNDIVVHVFVPEERDFYNLEKLWSDAPLVDVAQWVTE
ncbi:ribosome silencing factor [Lacticaseibacillus sp. N501-2]|uniref:ribosome silencing factor n=1 Tax=Lacticaseibacillus salsurae TaxID=3367729 RepID=UPI0038B2F111